MMRLADENLARIRERNTKDLEITVPYQSVAEMTIHTLLLEIDRLREIEALAREWLRVRYTSVESDAVHKLKQAFEESDG